MWGGPGPSGHAAQALQPHSGQTSPVLTYTAAAGVQVPKRFELCGVTSGGVAAAAPEAVRPPPAAPVAAATAAPVAPAGPADAPVTPADAPSVPVADADAPAASGGGPAGGESSAEADSKGSEGRPSGRRHARSTLGAGHSAVYSQCVLPPRPTPL